MAFRLAIAGSLLLSLATLAAPMETIITRYRELLLLEASRHLCRCRAMALARPLFPGPAAPQPWSRPAFSM